MPKVSIIVPIFNVEKYLRECLDSLINQTLDDIEIICANDGSTDNSAQILQEYRFKDKRIKVINLEKKEVFSVKILDCDMKASEITVLSILKRLKWADIWFDDDIKITIGNFLCIFYCRSSFFLCSSHYL